MTGHGPTQVICLQQHTQHLQRGVFGEALLVLPLDFSDVCQKLRKGLIPSLSHLAEMVVELCHEAGVEYGFAQPHMKEAILEQADVLSSELASSLKVSPGISAGTLLIIASESCLASYGVFALFLLLQFWEVLPCYSNIYERERTHVWRRRYLLASKNK